MARLRSVSLPLLSLRSADVEHRAAPPNGQSIRLFLCGDVMTGRGVDQILPHPCAPRLHEAHLHSAIDYVELAEKANGPIPRRVSPSYIWGAALDEFARLRPDARIINLETSITRSEDFAAKGINYRMSPENADCLLAAAIDCCVLANNHVLDWGRAGLLDTLASLQQRRIMVAGAGRSLSEARAPAVLDIAGKARVLIFAFASPTSGVPSSWAATPSRAGVNFLPELSQASAIRIAEQVEQVRRPRDVVVVSLHWGPNWGYEIDAQREFAHALIDKAGVSIVHGHSSHHAKGVEVYHDRLILYGCGDFLHDYEGIGGYERYRNDLALMYFVDIGAANGALCAVEMVVLQIRKFQLARASRQDVEWSQQTLDRESRQFGARVEMTADGGLALRWPH
jgi:poly-gamma-glutamate synthesis protein (capsule biosynthesis protein)